MSDKGDRRKIPRLFCSQITLCLSSTFPADELRTLKVRDLSFGDVPFLVLNSTNEKTRKGSSASVRTDIALDLRAWTDGKRPADLVLYVPTGLLWIMNRDLEAAGIPKIDDLDGRVHVRALRHSTGTHPSAANVAKRTAQTVMRHSDLSLTINTDTDTRLIDSPGAVQRLPELPLDGSRTLAPTLAAILDKRGKSRSAVAQFAGKIQTTEKQGRPVNRVIHGPMKKWS